MKDIEKVRPKIVGYNMGLPVVEITYWYAGRWRTAAGIAAHRAGRRERHRMPISRIKSDIASTAAKREGMIDATRPA